MTNKTIKDFSWKTLFRCEMLNILFAKYDHLYDSHRNVNFGDSKGYLTLMITDHHV